MDIFPGIYRGIVVDNDETNMAGFTKLSGRIEVIIPSVYTADTRTIKRILDTDKTAFSDGTLLESKLPTVWARPCFRPGKWEIPPIGAGVYIMFEDGLAAYPVWIGEWTTETGDMDLPTQITALAGDGKDYQVIKTTNHWLEFIDKSGDERLHYKNLHNNFEMTIDKDGNITFTLPANKKFEVLGGNLAEILGTSSLALKADVTQLKSDFDSHTHAAGTYSVAAAPGPVAGASGAPVAPATAPTGTTKLKGS